MKTLQRRIVEEGKVLSGSFVKLDSFLDQHPDSDLMSDIGIEFYSRFKDRKINKILTLEDSGIAVAMVTGVSFGAPVVFAKRNKTMNVDPRCFKSRIFSYVKKIEYDVVVQRDSLRPGDHVLVVGDFISSGNAIKGLLDIIEQSGASLAGVGIVVEKTFQNGGNELREMGLKFESLTRIKSITDLGITFED